MGEVNLPQPLVTVVIPCHNKAETVARAIESVKAQTINNLECFVVNDASTDESEANILAAISNDLRFSYHKVDYRNVALVRNHGIGLGSAPFCVALDADDWIDPQFLEACVPALEADSSLGAAYTGLYWHKPDGSEGLSLWPEEYDYDRFVKRRNQVPTCCVFRRDLWARLGGFRQRYAPTGAGAEDAEFYLRMGSIGYAAKKVTKAGLFHYSWMSGHTSQAGYKEVDWMAWHPWKDDGLHPFVSVATPVNKQAHPIRQYDSPTISVVIPVAAGHQQTLIDTLDSLEAQTFRFWEAVVVWDMGGHPPQSLKTAYPYVKWCVMDSNKGAGAARNLGVKYASAPFIVFLDADDWLQPKALEQMVKGWRHHESAIYGDYLAIATVEDVNKLTAKDRGNLVQYNEHTKEALIRYQLPDFDYEKAMKQPENPPYLWCNVTTMIPRAWHDEIGGFDESMESWEDVLYWYKLAWAGRPFKRVAQPMLVYRFNSGSRRDVGIKMWDKLMGHILEVKENGM